MTDLAVSLLIAEAHAAAFEAVANDPEYATIDRLALHRLTFAALAAAAPVISASYRAEAEASIVEGIAVASERIRPSIEKSLVDAHDRATAVERERHAPLVAAVRGLVADDRGLPTRELFFALADLDAAHNPVATGAVSATQPSGQVFEGLGKGGRSSEDLRASQGFTSPRIQTRPLPVESVPGERFIPHSRAAGSQPGINALIIESQELRELCVKRWDKIEKLRGKLDTARTDADNLRRTVEDQLAENKRLRTLVDILESTNPDGEEYEAAEQAILQRWPDLASNRVYVQHLAETTLDAAWSVFHQRHTEPGVDDQTAEEPLGITSAEALEAAAAFIPIVAAQGTSIGEQR